jgi:hypothetical protein
MRRIHRVWASCLVGLVALGVTEARAQGRIPNFPMGVAISDSSGRSGAFWLGADSPFGTYIGPDVSFWAFGDTFLNPPGVNGRQLSNVVGNTIAIGQIVDGNFTPRYFYNGTADNRRAFFPDPGPSHKYWPKASALIEGKLYVFLSLMYVNPRVPAGDPAGAQDTGSVIARVLNPTDIPTNWRVEYIALHRENAGRQAILKLGTEILPAPGARSLIVYGLLTNAKTKSYKAVVTLVSYDALKDTPAGLGVDPSQVQYLAADASNANPRWRPGLGTYNGPSDDYLNTEIDCISGFTVRWNAILAKWQVVGAFSQFAASSPYPRNHPYKPQPTARIFTHPTPFGPFVNSPEAKTCYFYTFPELKSRETSLCCYTARQWQDAGDPRYNTDANLLFTYTFSSRDMNKALADTNVYQNHYALIPNPFSGSLATQSACADIPKPASAPIAGNHPLADPFGAPGVPYPMTFPVKVGSGTGR